MYCLACNRKLPPIKADQLYSKWNRKYHKKCWNDQHIYSHLYNKGLEVGLDKNSDVMKDYLKRCCEE